MTSVIKLRLMRPN